MVNTDAHQDWAMWTVDQLPIWFGYSFYSLDHAIYRVKVDNKVFSSNWKDFFARQYHLHLFNITRIYTYRHTTADSKKRSNNILVSTYVLVKSEGQYGSWCLTETDNAHAIWSKLLRSDSCHILSALASTAVFLGLRPVYPLTTSKKRAPVKETAIWGELITCELLGLYMQMNLLNCEPSRSAVR